MTDQTKEELRCKIQRMTFLAVNNHCLRGEVDNDERSYDTPTISPDAIYGWSVYYDYVEKGLSIPDDVVDELQRLYEKNVELQIELAGVHPNEKFGEIGVWCPKMKVTMQWPSHIFDDVKQ